MNWPIIRIAVYEALKLLTFIGGVVAAAFVVFAATLMQGGEYGAAADLTALATGAGLIAAVAWWLGRSLAIIADTTNNDDAACAEDDPAVTDAAWDQFLAAHERELPSRASVWLARIRTSRTEVDR